MTTLLTREPLAPTIPPTRDEDALYEIVDGRYVELPPMSTFAAIVTTRLGGHLISYNEQHGLGHPAVEALFGLTPKLRRRPDAAFVAYERWPKGRPIPATDPWPVVPNLAVEVVSPTDDAEPLMRKVAEYLRSGVEQVWVVFPMLKLAYVYESLTSVRGFEESQELDGGQLFPGFKLPLAKLFADAPPLNPEPENGPPA
jgi:Uma2 family endonuclease